LLLFFQKKKGLLFERKRSKKILMFVHRVATESDIPALQLLMADAISHLQRGFLSDVQIEASRQIMGLDTQLIADGTYFVVHAGTALAGCGGWSRRATLYGGDHSGGRSARLLEPASEPARIRAMYTSPAFVRRGVGRLILSLCEAAAAAEGFTRAEMGATLAGVPLYEACGYRSIAPIVEKIGGVEVPLLRMGKAITQKSA
jgi:GNAT superfamily N-acetyltransferase